MCKVLKCNYFANDKLVSHLGDKKRGFFLQRQLSLNIMMELANWHCR